MPDDASDASAPPPDAVALPLPRFVQRVVKPNGKVHLYFRKAGQRKALRSTEGSAELQAEVDRLVAKLAKDAPEAGTVAAAIKDYRAGADYGALATSTKVEYERWLGEIRDDMGDVALAEIDPAFILDQRDIWALRGHRAANIALQVLKNVLKRPITVGTIAADPFTRIDAVKRPHDAPEPHPIWFPHEVGHVLAIKRDGFIRAIALARYAAARRGDLVRMPETAIAGGRIRWRSGKRGVQVDIHVRPELAAVMKRTKRKAVTIAYTEDETAWTLRGLEQALARHLKKLVKEKKVRKGLTLHGLRHTFGVELALAGASDSEIMSAMGLTSQATVLKYRRQADRIRLADAGMARVMTLPLAGAVLAPPAPATAANEK